MPAGLRLDRVGVDYGAVTAVGEVTLDLAAGGLTALLGPSGCGKTTLLRVVAGLERPSRGRLLLDGTDITALPAEARRFGVVFQSFALFPHLSVADNVAYSLAIAGVGRTERRARAEELLRLVQLGGYGARRIGALSGGQRQRVAIARALAQEPRVFLLDEPMSALDAKLREEMQVELRLLQQRLAITTVVVTHDQREAMTMADRIVVMSAGAIEQVGTPAEIYHKPASAFVASFIGRANRLEGRVCCGAIETAAGWLRPKGGLRFIEGAAVQAMCRPERVWLRPATEPGENRLPARVVFVRDMGHQREIHLGLGLDAQGERLIADVPATDTTPFAVGDSVTAEIAPEALLVFPGQGTERPLEVAR
ncbi:MAG: ABC transporter ATP-binding protein [Pseudomonadota bacterium]